MLVTLRNISRRIERQRGTQSDDPLRILTQLRFLSLEPCGGVEKERETLGLVDVYFSTLVGKVLGISALCESLGLADGMVIVVSGRLRGEALVVVVGEVLKGVKDARMVAGARMGSGRNTVPVLGECGGGVLVVLLWLNNLACLRQARCMRAAN